MRSTLQANLLATAGYCLLGLATEFLTIPPDFATPVWPAAGLALALVILYGARVLPGILVGATAANTLIALWQGHPFSSQQLLFAFMIALGAAAQAQTTAALLRFLTNKENMLEWDRDIVRFVIIAGPVGCLISSTNGATQLSLFGIVSWHHWVSNWLIWWVGDAVGTLLVAPTVLHLLSPKSGYRLHRRILLSLPSFLLLLLVILAFYYVRDLGYQKRQSVVAENGQRIAADIRWHLQDTKYSLKALQGLYYSSDVVTETEFSQFAEHLKREFPMILSLQWSPLIRDKEREDLEQSMAQSGHPDFAIFQVSDGGTTPADSHPLYFPELYRFPPEPHFHPAGIDSYQGANRLLIQQALAGNRIMFSTPFSVQSDTGSTWYYRGFAPVYKDRSHLTSSMTQNFDNVLGLVQITISLDATVHNIIAQLPQDIIELSILDITDPAHVTRIWGTDQATTPLTWSTDYALGNRLLILKVAPLPNLLNVVSQWQTYGVLVVGLLCVAMLEILLLSLTDKQASIERIVEQKTRELATAKELAENANRVKTYFLACMSHELRTPLNGIIGFSRRILNYDGDNLSTRSREGLEIVQRNSRHLLGLINDLLDLSRVEAGKFRVSMTLFDLSALLRDIRVQFSPEASSKGLRLVVVEPEQPLMIEADPQRVLQILINLVNNAIKYTSQGSIRVEHHFKSERDVPGLELTVQDTGMGIAKEDMPKLFNQFEQLQQHGSQIIKGTGLGLALVKVIVTQHRGKISVDSTLGQGSVFRVWLPMSQAPDQGTIIQ